MDEQPSRDEQPGTGRRLRWRRFPIVVTALAATGLAVLWLAKGVDRDERNFFTIPIVALTLLVLFLWLVLWADISRRARGAVVGAALVVLAVPLLALRLEGFTGDFVPRIEFRWRARPDERLELPAATEREQAATADLGRTTPQDFPQFLGPQRRATVDSVHLARDWQAHPPRLLWRRPVGLGWSAFAVVGRYAVTQEQWDEQEVVTCRELRSGRIVWTHADPVRFHSVMGGDGPRATPTVFAGKVYAQSPTGLLNCLDGQTGRRLWSRDIQADNGARNIEWGRSGSPLLVDKLVVVSAGGPDGRSLVAYHKDTGQRIWSGGSDVASYSSPALATLGGVRQVLIVNQDWLASHRLADGHTLWRHPWPGNSGSNASASQAVPLAGDRVFVSKGYHGGCALLQVAGSDGGGLRVTQLWQRPTLLKTKMTNVVVRQGYVFGLSQGILECVELRSGKRRWKRGRYGHGQVLLVDDLILVTSESGAVALVEASPDAFRELGRFQALEGKTWNNPALAGPLLLVRNSEEAACYELPLVREGGGGF